MLDIILLNLFFDVFEKNMLIITLNFDLKKKVVSTNLLYFFIVFSLLNTRVFV